MDSLNQSPLLHGRHSARSLSDLLTHWVDGVTFSRGKQYALQGRITHFDANWDDEETLTLNGKVLGSGNHSYLTQVKFSALEEDWHDLTGNCNCPVGYDCKHAVAMVWYWAQKSGVLRDGSAASPTNLTTQAPQPSSESTDLLGRSASKPRTLKPESPPNLRARPFSGELNLWLDRTYAYSEQSEAKPVSTSADKVVYLLNAVGLLSVAKARQNRTGQLRRSSQTASLAWVRHGNKMPSYVAEEDEPILRLLESLQDVRIFAPQVSLAGQSGHTLLQMALRTGRCFYVESVVPETFEKPLSWGDSRAGQFVWQAPLVEQASDPAASANKARIAGSAKSSAKLPIQSPGFRLQFKDASEQTLMPIATAPLLAIDCATQQIVPIQSSLTCATLERLLSLPAMTEHDTDAWRFVHDAWKSFPDAKHIPPPPVDASPLPVPQGVLRFALLEITMTQGWGRNTRETTVVVPAVELNVIYPDGRRMVPQLLEGAPLIEDKLENGRVVDTYLRNGRAERTWGLRMPAQLRSLAEVEPSLFYSLTALARRAYWGLPRHAWTTDGPRVLAAAQEAGFLLEIEPGFPLTLEDIPEPELELIPAAQNGWFRFSLGVDIGGKRVDLAPAFARLIGAQQDPQAWVDALSHEDKVLLSLADGRVVRLPGDRVRNMLTPVLAWFQGGAVDEISSLQAALLPQLVHYRGRDNEAWLAMREKLNAGAALTAILPSEGFKATLRPYQLSGLAWLAHLKDLHMGAVLADDMGLGKTVQTLAHLHREHGSASVAKPSLIVAPTSVVGNWRTEATKFAPQVRVLVHHGKARTLSKKALEKIDVVITSYPILQRDENALSDIDWHIVVFDEAQVLKNAKAKTHQAAQRLNAQQRLALTGTPMENHLGELWAIFNVLSPGLLGDLETFNRHFRHRIEQNSDSERMAALRQRIRPFLLRRTRDAVLTELPQKTETVRWIDLDAGQADLYESLRTAIHDDIKKVIDKKGLKQSTIHILDALLKLRQACCDPRLVKVPGHVNIDAQSLPSAKLEWLMEHVPMLIEEGRRILIFSQFTSMLAIIEAQLCAAGINYVLLTGDTTDRETPIARFQAGAVPVFLLSLKAGGVGLNLTAADTVIHYDPWWNPAVEAQATARAHRIGQDKPVFVYKLIAKGTLEEKMMALLERKQQLAAALLDGSGGALAGLTAKDVDDLLAPIESLLPTEGNA